MVFRSWGVIILVPGHIRKGTWVDPANCSAFCLSKKFLTGFYSPFEVAGLSGMGPKLNLLPSVARLYCFEEGDVCDRYLCKQPKGQSHECNQATKSSNRD